MAVNEGINGSKFVSTFYSPFYYFEGDDPFEDWTEYRNEIIYWLEENEANLFVVNSTTMGGDYVREMLEREEGQLFEYVGQEWLYKVYRVTIE